MFNLYSAHARFFFCFFSFFLYYREKVRWLAILYAWAPRGEVALADCWGFFFVDGGARCAMHVSLSTRARTRGEWNFINFLMLLNKLLISEFSLFVYPSLEAVGTIEILCVCVSGKCGSETIYTAIIDLHQRTILIHISIIITSSRAIYAPADSRFSL